MTHNSISENIVDVDLFMSNNANAKDYHIFTKPLSIACNSFVKRPNRKVYVTIEWANKNSLMQPVVAILYFYKTPQHRFVYVVNIYLT